MPQLKSVMFASDGRDLISTGEDKLVRVWDVQTGMIIRMLRGHFRQPGTARTGGECRAAGGLGGTLLVLIDYRKSIQRSCRARRTPPLRHLLRTSYGMRSRCQVAVNMR